MAIDWAEDYDVLMGWNQIVKVEANGTTTKIKVKDFNVGIKQTVDVPELVVGATDRNTWAKGVIEVTGNISAPLTLSFADTIVRAANDAAQAGPYRRITLSSTVHGSMPGCMVNTCRISAESGGPIEVQAEVWGRLGVRLNSSTSALDAAVTSIGGMPEGALADASDGSAALSTEQIPYFDQVVIPNGFLPSNSSYLMPTAVTFSWENNLIRNYVLGMEGEASSLDAFSISAGQRKLSGTMTFMSGTTGQLAYNINAGMGESSFSTDLDFAGLIKIKGEKYRPLWSAAPPALNNQKVVIELEFVLIATEPGFWITVGD